MGALMAGLLKLPNGAIIAASDFELLQAGTPVNGFWLENGRPVYGVVKHG